MRGQKLLQLGTAVFLGVAVGVLPVGEEHQPHMHPFCKEQVYGSQCRLDARRVSVVEYGDIGGIALYQSYLFGGQARTATGNGVLHTALVHRYHIHIALHQIALVGLRYCRTCLVESIEYAALVVDVRVG